VTARGGQERRERGDEEEAKHGRYGEGVVSIAAKVSRDHGARERERPEEGHRTLADITHHPTSFSTAVHGTVFARRSDVVRRLAAGDRLLLVPDPPGAEVPAVWVHAVGGDVVGHLPVQVAAWLAPRMLTGTRCRARVEHVGTDDVASWNRLIITVECSDVVQSTAD